MARRLSRRRRSGEGTKIALGVGLGFLALCGFGALGYAFFAAPKPVLTDKATLCPMSGPTGVTVVLIDSTDALGPTAQLELRQRLLDVGEAVPKGTLLELRTLDGVTPGGKIAFSLCNPGSGADLSELTGNPQMANRKWNAGFKAPLETALKGSMAASPSKISPIMEAIQRIALERFTGTAANERSKTLIVISDMLENTPHYSQYAGDAKFQRYRQTQAYQRFRTDLHGATVSLYYIQRQVMPKGLTPVDHIGFWQEWIRDNKGQFTEALRIQGVS